MKKRLLVVDDDASVRESLKRVLEHAGYEVELAADAAEAEGKFDDHSFDLLILDLNLPDRDGWDVLERVSSSYPLLPVILITGLIDQLETLIIPGASALLEKPVEAPVILRTIEELLVAGSKGDINRTTSVSFSSGRAVIKRRRGIMAPDAK